MSREPEGGTAAYGTDDASFQAAGGVEGIERLADDFYRLMDELPEAAAIRRMHPKDLAESRDKLARFLCGWLGGPSRYRERYGPIHIPRAHAHLRIGEAERDAWLLCMEKAIANQPFDEAFRSYLLRELGVPAQRVLEASKRPL